ncbi:Oxidoreductase [Tieghemostelium lacteum]|uniref:Oxidoreductase n=1 Tax=Tieghemostelium lacteum TaxID=361077 RepID=A0A151ZRL7_TIELA|nr:Oxidoreductase [Tieghemostelium lacteum]|eukprot:KYQ96671.1 Oxidoreductase [Tieghemostelium lacteum]
MNSFNKKIWLISGTSSGIGLSLVQKILDIENSVVALTRSPEDLKKQLNIKNSLNLLIIKTDLNEESNVKEAVELAIKTFGRIDVVVNNAGYGYLTSFEECSLKEYKELFNINFFGYLNIIHSTLPYMRKQENKGLILNMSSNLGSLVVFPGFTPYISSKFAINGFTQSLDLELKTCGIRAVILSPGAFRTKLLNKNHIKIGTNEIKDYKIIEETSEMFRNYNENQPGDPDKLANAIIEISNRDRMSLPSNIFFGTDAYTTMKNQIEKLINELESNKNLSVSTDY